MSLPSRVFLTNRDRNAVSDETNAIATPGAVRPIAIAGQGQDLK